MKVIRPNVFETNSSSSHSIVIDYDSKGFEDTLFVDKNGECLIVPGPFGWGFEEYTDAITKASYCATYVLTLSQEENYKVTSDNYVKMLIEVIKEKTGAKSVRFGRFSETDPNGYIDHQSHVGNRNTCGKMFISKKKLSAFIFNAQYKLIIDNDNH